MFGQTFYLGDPLQESRFHQNPLYRRFHLRVFFHVGPGLLEDVTSPVGFQAQGKVHVPIPGRPDFYEFFVRAEQSFFVQVYFGDEGFALGQEILGSGGGKEFFVVGHWAGRCSLEFGEDRESLQAFAIRRVLITSPLLFCDRLRLGIRPHPIG